MKLSKIAEDAINLFLEYRDVHGYPENEAIKKAVYEFFECETEMPINSLTQPTDTVTPDG